MYEGKHLNKSKTPKRKSTVLLVSLLALCITVGGTLAYLATHTDSVVNTFTPSTVTTAVTENFDGTTKTNVKIQNTGDTTAYIRAAVVVTWQDADGNVYGQEPVKGEDYSISWTKSGWVEAADGFYYYTEPVAAGASTGELFTNCSSGAGEVPDGYYLAVEILGSGIQSVPTSVVTDVWSSGVAGIDPDDGITLLIKPVIE